MIVSPDPAVKTVFMTYVGKLDKAPEIHPVSDVLLFYPGGVFEQKVTIGTIRRQ
jgi:hypothetical protein